MSNGDSAAKILLRLDGFAEDVLLFSRKKAKGTPRHGRFELLGGGLDGNRPLEGLVRELEEEEKTGTLAKFVRNAAPTARLLTVNGTAQYVFELTLPYAVYLDMRHAGAESMGFVVVPLRRLGDPGMAGRFTSKTVGILSALQLI